MHPSTDEAARDRAPATRVLLVDDHEVLASSLALVLDSEPDLTSVGVAGSLADARRLIGTTAPDVLLLDHRRSRPAPRGSSPRPGGSRR